MDFIGEPTYWHWFILGVALIVVEMLAPGIVFLWLGLAALATGVVLSAATHLTWDVQLLLFAGLSAVSIYAGRRFVAKRVKPHDHPGLNARGSNYIGRSYVLDDPIHNGNGRLMIDGILWSLSGPDASAGARIKVIGMDGTVLLIEPADGDARPLAL